MRTILLLIDGYNLLFQSQLVGKGRGPGWLDKARRRLLVLLSKALTSPERLTTTIVFDASQSGQATADFLFDSSIEVRFANAYAEADDLLEELIRQNPHSKRLRVVSSDQRIRRCARARKAESIDSESFLDQLERSQLGRIAGAILAEENKAANISTTDAPSAEAGALSSDEVAFWLNEFGHASLQDEKPRKNRET